MTRGRTRLVELGKRYANIWITGAHCIGLWEIFGTVNNDLQDSDCGSADT